MSTKEQSPQEIREAKAKVRETLRQHRFAKYATELLLRATIKTNIFMQHGPEGLRLLKDPEQMSGLIEGAILGPKLCYPDPNIGALIYKSAQGGLWLAHDFKRPEEFPSASKKRGVELNSEGKLFGFMLDEVRSNDAEDRTPIGKLSLLSLDHLLTFDSYTAAELVGEGMLRATTYREAYTQVGLSEYVPDLESRSLAEDKVFQVTPKGNTLVGLLPESGSASPKRSPQFESRLAPVRGLH